MSRKELALRHIDSEGKGIEIGPCYDPIAPKCEGFRVHVIDHMTRDQLLEKYGDQRENVDLDRIEEVDFVWRGEGYAELTGAPRSYDWIIASHVIEHTPDLIGFINNCDGVLKEDGVLSLVIPDKRFCFDHFRPLTGISSVIDSHLADATIHTTGTIVEFYLNVVANAGVIAWDEAAPPAYTFVHTPEEARGWLGRSREEVSYQDTHSWCFVPASFRLMIQDLNDLGLISLREVDFIPTTGCEFYVTLGRRGRDSERPRMEMLEEIERQCRHAAREPEPPTNSRVRLRNLAALFSRRPQRSSAR